MNRPKHRDHEWRYDIAAARTHDGRALWMLVVEEHARESLAIDV